MDCHWEAWGDIGVLGVLGAYSDRVVVEGVELEVSGELEGVWG